MRRLFAVLVFTCTISGLAVAQGFSALKPKDQQAISTVLANQQAAWNRGDLPAFMEGYAESEAIRFVGKNGITYGYRQVLERYQQSYPSQEAMGVLEFTLVHFDRLSPKTALVTGNWRLDGLGVEGSAPGGFFTLVFRKSKTGWRAVYDHTS